MTLVCHWCGEEKSCVVTNAVAPTGEVFQAAGCKDCLLGARVVLDEQTVVDAAFKEITEGEKP